MTPSGDPVQEIWRRVVEIHNRTKARLIYCEEAEVEHKTFLQPRNELCNALEHIIRAKAHELGLGSAVGVGPDYEIDSLDKALGHEFRAFYDVCDWLSIILREEIARDLGRYSPEVIQKVIPEYYTTIRPKLDGIPGRIAALRAKKDIKAEILNEVLEYDRVLDELMQFRQELAPKIPSLEELQKGERRGKWANWTNAVLLLVLGAAITWAWEKLVE